MPLTRRTVLLSSLAAAAQTANGPNVVVILCDDLGYGDVGVYNPQSKISTPQLDNLARYGVRFTDAHSPSAVCTPTRYGLLTGRYAWRTSLKSGVLNGYSPALIEDGRETIASFLKKRGYRTGGFGKWHLGLGRSEKVDFTQEFRPSPNDFGFDEYYGIPASLDMPPYVFFENRKAVEPPTATIGDSGEPKRGPFWRGGPRSPGFRMEDVVPNIVQRAKKFIEQQKGPFFAYIALPAPHTPWVPAKEYQGKSKAGLYGDFVQQVDDSIGQILASIQSAGHTENTLVVVTSDNGAPWERRDADEAAGHMANASWRGQKADIQEAGHRIPFLVRWPGRARANAVCNRTICLTDIFATVVDLQHIAKPNTFAEDSVSFLPLLRNPTASQPRDSLVHHSAQGLFSIRQGEWKLIAGRGSGGFSNPAKITPGPGEPAGELYNLKTDPHEDRNLYVERPDIVARLTEGLEKLQR